MPDDPIDSELGRRCLLEGGVELAWDRWGADDGRPFVLCHGFSGSAHDFALNLADLVPGRPVIALDHRGHGRSTKTHDLASYTVDQLATDFITFLEATAPDGVDLLGHSMGGRISLVTTLRRPDLVRSLILMDTSAWSFRPTDPAVSDLMAAFLDGFDPTRGLPSNLGPPGPEDPLIAERTPVAWQERKLALSAGFDPYALKGLGRELFADAAHSVRSRLAEIRCPVSVIVGALDEPYAGQAPDLAAEVGARRLTVIDGAYHSPQLTHPAEWAAAVEDHLAAVAG